MMRALDRFVTWCENHQRTALTLAGALILAATLIPGQVTA